MSSPLRIHVASFLLIAAALMQYAIGGDLYVDNIHGSDASSGRKEAPLRSIKIAAKALKAGHTLHLVPNDVPYTLEDVDSAGSVGLVELVSSQAGTREKPTMIDGHGAKVLGLFHYTAERWRDEGSSVFSMRLPNNTVTMFNLGFWAGVIPIVFYDDQPAQWVKSRDELVAGSFFLVKKLTEEDPQNNTLFVKLAEGNTPADIKITAPSNITIQSNASQVTIKNIESSYSSFDGFGSFWGDGLVFENLRASYNMNQGMSHHSSAGVLIRHCRFDHNVDCGVLDVSLGDAKAGDEKAPTRARYENCLVDNNAWLGGVRFQNRGTYEMEACIIRDNRATTAVVSVGRNTSLTLRNCIIQRGDADAKTGIMAEAHSTLELRNCTIVGFQDGLVGERGANVTVSHCSFVDCDVAIALPPSVTAKQMRSDHNCFIGKARFKVDTQIASSLEEFRAMSGQDRHSVAFQNESELDARDGAFGASVNPKDVGVSK